jgi:hypothetical protein
MTALTLHVPSQTAVPSDRIRRLFRVFMTPFLPPPVIVTYEPFGDGDFILKPKEAAKFLRIAPGTLRKWTRDGIGPIAIPHTSGSYGYLLSDLKNYLLERRAKWCAVDRR